MPKYQIGDIVMTTGLAHPMYYLIEGMDESCYHWRFLGQPTIEPIENQDKSTGKALQELFDTCSLNFVKVA